MPLVVVFAIAGGLAVFVVFPLLSADGGAKETLPVDVTPLSDLRRRRLVAYENLQDLEFEYQAKKIALEDYERLRQNYRREAAQLMAAAQDLEHTAVEDNFIEDEVARRRGRRRLPAVESYVCAQCGFENPLPVKFCGECGSRITPRTGR